MYSTCTGKKHVHARNWSIFCTLWSCTGTVSMESLPKINLNRCWSRFSWQLVQGLNGKRITGVSCGFSHTLCVDDQGDLHGWGKGTWTYWVQAKSWWLSRTKFLQFFRFCRFLCDLHAGGEGQLCGSKDLHDPVRIVIPDFRCVFSI